MPEEQKTGGTVHAFFSVATPEQDVVQVTRSLGQEPSRVTLLRMADPSDPTKTVELHSWQLISPLPESAHVNKHVEALLEKLLPHAGVVRSLVNRYDGGSIHCVVSYYEDYATPGIELWQATIHSLADLGLAVTFDLYYFGARGRPPG